MKVIVERHSVRHLFRWTQRALFAISALLLSCYGFVTRDTWNFQRTESVELDRRLRTPSPVAIVINGVLGRIDIESVGISAIVVEGTNTASLSRAVGHISGTALPGQPGNVGLSAHRDTFFRPLRHIEANHIIRIATPHGEYRYRVVSTKVVRPSDVSVLDAGTREVLTLVTCYPFYFIGPAPRRFIVRAERIA